MRRNILLLLLGLLLCLLRPSVLRADEARAMAYALRWWQGRAVTADVARAQIRVAARYEGLNVYTKGPAFLLLTTQTAEPQIIGYGAQWWAQSPTQYGYRAQWPAQYGYAQDLAPLPPALGQALWRVKGAHPLPPLPADWRAVEPLLTSVRDQGAPYNALAPRYLADDGTLSDERCLTGCVATAMEQILSYYRRTYTLRDTLRGWTTSHYVIPSVAPGASVDTRLIRDRYDEGYTEAEGDAVSRLTYYLGVAAHMNWGLSESGAQSRLLAEPLKRVFGLPYVHYLDSYLYNPTAYRDYLAREIMAGRPVYYAGSLMRMGGHAFVLDGLDADGLFHVNWGYGGAYDGYFRLDVLYHPQPEADRADDYVEDGFYCNQEAITLCPDEVNDALVPDTLERTGREIVIDSIALPLEPRTGCYTPVHLMVHNTSATDTLTTPLGLLLNAPTDTALLAQADWRAYTGCTLAPGQRDTLVVHAWLNRTGPALLSVTPDGRQLLKTRAIDGLPGGTMDIATDEPAVTFPDEGTAEVSLRLTNPAADVRASQVFFIEMVDRATAADRNVARYVYLRAGADTTLTVPFRGLTPGGDYTLNIRRNWPVVRTLTFRMPVAQGIDEAAAEQGGGAPRWHSLDGRALDRLQQPGVNLRTQGGRTTKVVVP